MRLQISPIFIVSVMTLTSGLALACNSPEETFDNIDSRVQCKNYCDKLESCGDDDVDDDACVSDCRGTIEDVCGNEHQGAANDKIAECVDKGCAEFSACMVFEAAPECFGFVP
jgi:hypothetical protein